MSKNKTKQLLLRALRDAWMSGFCAVNQSKMDKAINYFATKLLKDLGTETDKTNWTSKIVTKGVTKGGTE